MNLPLKLLVGEDGGGLWDGDGSLRGADGGLGRSLGAGRMVAGEGASVRGGRCPATGVGGGGGQPPWGTGGAASGELGAGV